MKRNDDQTCLRLPAPLREQLAIDAAALGRSISWLIRKTLIEHYAARAERARAERVKREKAKDEAHGATA